MQKTDDSSQRKAGRKGKREDDGNDEDSNSQKGKLLKSSVALIRSHPSHEHPLSYAVPAYADGWRCDMCSKKGVGLAVWHCDSCSYDLCDGCMNQALSTPADRQQGQEMGGSSMEISSNSGNRSSASTPVMRSVASASIEPSPASLEDIDPSRSAAGFLETFALSSNRVDALLLATPGTEDSYFYAGLAQLHSSGNTGGNLEYWKLFLQKYRATFGDTQRYQELLWRSRFGQYDAGMLSKNDQKEFLAQVADEMRYGPERDRHGKIVDINSHFRRWSQDNSIWQPKERRGLSQPPMPPSPPAAPYYTTKVDDVRIAAESDPTIGEVPQYFKAFLKGESLSPWGGYSSNSTPSISELTPSADSAVFLGLNWEKVHTSLCQQALDYFSHPSQPNFYKFFLSALDHEWHLSEKRIAEFQKLPAKERHGRTLESVQQLEKNTRQSTFNHLFDSKRALFCQDTLNTLLVHATYGNNALTCDNFVEAYLSKLQPNADFSGWETLELPHKVAYYEAIYNFAEKADTQLLRPEFLNLKFVAMFHWLDAESEADVWSWNRFNAYIRVVKEGNAEQFVNSSWRQSEVARNKKLRIPDLDRHPWSQLPHLHSPSYDSHRKLINAFVWRHYSNRLAEADGSAFNAYLDDAWLRSVLATTRLLSGDAPAKWLAMLAQEDVRRHFPASEVQALQERVDLELAATNRKYFSDPDEPVTISIYTKNVRQLLVKVYEVNTEAYYRANREEITTDINLDGLAPNLEQLHKYDASPLHRVLRTFHFPQLGNQRGVFVVEFIAQGRSSRAVVRRGGLRFVERVSVAGHVLTILDEKNRVVRGCKALVDSNEYLDAPAPAGAQLSGEIVIPFSASPNSRRPIVIQLGDYACLDYLNHQSESYSLSAGFILDREQLIKDSTAHLLVRSALYLNGQPVPLAVLEEVTLCVDIIDKEGVANSKVEKNFTLHDDRESVYALRVPDDLRSVAVRLEAKVAQESSGSGVKQSLTASWSCQLNQSEDDSDTQFGPLQPHLRVLEDGSFEVIVLGRTGESRPYANLDVWFKHALLSSEMHVSCSTNDRGAVSLGRLRNIQSVRTNLSKSPWNLERFTSRRTQISLPPVLHGKAATRPNQLSLMAPYVGDDSLPPPSDAAAARAITLKSPSQFDAVLYRLAGDGSYLQNVSNKTLRLDPTRGLLHLEGLAAGDYELYYPRYDHRCRVRVAQTLEQALAANAPDSSPTPTSQQFVLGVNRFLEVQELVPVLAVAVHLVADHKEIPPSALEAWERNAPSVRTADEDKCRQPSAANDPWLLVQLSSISPSTRVHIICSEMLPLFETFEAFNVTSVPELSTVSMTPRASQYLDGRILGEEYRYVLDRKHAARRLGNMNRQPSLLLNPWALQATDTATQAAKGGTSYDSKSVSASRLSKKLAREIRGVSGVTDRYCLDFLGEPGTVLANLRPSGKSLCIAVPRAALGAGGLVQVFVIDGLRVHSRWLPVPRVVPARLLAAAAEAASSSASQKLREQHAASRKLLGSLPYRDLRLLPLAALAPTEHFVERRAAEPITAGTPLVVSDISSNTVGLYDTLAKVHSLFTALGPSAHLQSFAFLVRWGQMSEAEKAKLYSQYACHELHWFIYRKDEAFFRRVVKPHIAQKLEKQLIDWWLLSAVDAPTESSHPTIAALLLYLEPGRMSALNVFERILLYQRLKRCNVWPYADAEGGIVQHVKDLLERAGSAVAADDPVLFKNALACGALDPDAVKAAREADGALPPPPPPPADDLKMSSEDEAEDDEEIPEQTKKRRSHRSSEPMMDMQAEVCEEASFGMALDDAGPLAKSSKRKAFAPSAPMAAMTPMMSLAAPIQSQRQQKNEELRSVMKDREKEREAKPTRGGRATTLDRDQAVLFGAKQKQLQSDLARRGNIAQTFKQLEKTQEWTEAQYYQAKPERLDKQAGTAFEHQRTRVSAFWLAVAERVEAQPQFLEQPFVAGAVPAFLSPTFLVQGRGTFADQVFALSLLDLPFVAALPNMQFSPSRVVISSAQPMIAFYRDLTAVPVPGAPSSSHSAALAEANAKLQTQLQEKHQVKVEQFFYDPLFRKQTNYDNNNEVLDYWVSKEFAQNKVYGCVVRVTSTRPAGAPNQRPQQLKLDIMTQIPVGALPVGRNAYYTKSRPVQLSSGQAAKVELEFQFYFPATGKYELYPAHVSVDNALAGFAGAVVLNVVAQLTPPPAVPQPPVDKTKWEYISQCGSDDEMFEHLQRVGPHQCNLDWIQFRCRKSVDFYRRLAAHLRKRQFTHLNSAAWAFAWYDPQGIAEFLSQPQLTVNSSLHERIKPPFCSFLLKRDSMTRVAANEAAGAIAVPPSLVGVDSDDSADHLYLHLEYAPLVNARAHTLGQVRRILNNKFAEQYTAFLSHLARRPHLRAVDLMASSYYLLLLDRIDEAQRLFARIALLPDSPASVSRYLTTSAATSPPIDASGNPRQPSATGRRNLEAEFAAAPRAAPVGLQAHPSSPRYFDTQIQFDYLVAFFDFYDAKYFTSAPVGVPQLASQMCTKYRDYPVPHWAARFSDMADQLKELESFSAKPPHANIPSSGAEPMIVAPAPSKNSDLASETSKDNNKPDPERMRVLLAKMWQRTRPSFDIVLNGKQLSLDYANVNTVQLRYYIMDLELLFSTQPFFLSQHVGGGASTGTEAKKQSNSLYIKPNLSHECALPSPSEAVLVAAAPSGASAPMHTHVVDLPAALQDKNLIIEAVVPGGARKTVTYFANSLLLSVQAQVGQLQVLSRPIVAGSASRPIAGAYVKVYAKLHDDSDAFWKDLYTDLRGRADYCSLSDAASELSNVKAFSILVVSDAYGSVIREVPPPGL